jgi:hypothetical protein
MTTFTEGPRTAEFLISEGNGHFSRDVGTLGGDYQPGTVLGKVTTGGALKIYDPAAEDGTQTVHSILFEGGVSGDERTIVRRSAEVKASKLTWFSGATANQIATGVAALAGLGIVVR